LLKKEKGNKQGKQRKLAWKGSVVIFHHYCAKPQKIKNYFSLQTLCKRVWAVSNSAWCYDPQPKWVESSDPFKAVVQIITSFFWALGEA